MDQEVTIEAMDEDDGEAEAGRRGRSLATPGAVRSMAMSPELSADAPSLSLDGGGGMGLQQAHEPARQPARCLPPKPGLKRHQPAPASALCQPQPAPACPRT